jgi:hypothetical protein
MVEVKQIDAAELDLLFEHGKAQRWLEIAILGPHAPPVKTLSIGPKRRRR